MLFFLAVPWPPHKSISLCPSKVTLGLLGREQTTRLVIVKAEINLNVVSFFVAVTDTFLWLQQMLNFTRYQELNSTHI